MAWLLAEIAWFGLAAGIILIDRQMVAASTKPDEPDLKDRSITQYLLFMILFGGFIIPFYLWNSRRNGGAVLVGLVLMVVCATVVGTILRTVPS
jgi:hypothetical protein